MNKTMITIALALATAVLLNGCSEEKPPVPKKQPKATHQKVQPTAQRQEPIQAQAQKLGSWPYINGDQSQPALAENIMAKNYLLIFDGSGSMQKSGCSGGRQKIEVAKEAVVEWSKTISSDANLGLYAFHKGQRSILPLASGPRQEFIETIRQIQPGGKTPLSAAVAYAYEACTNQAKRQLGYGEYTIVVVTDGIADNENRLYRSVRSVLQSSPINIYCIGFCIGENHSLNQPGLTIYKAADNPAELRKGLEEVLAESETFDDTVFSN